MFEFILNYDKDLHIACVIAIYILKPYALSIEK